MSGPLGSSAGGPFGMLGPVVAAVVAVLVVAAAVAVHVLHAFDPSVGPDPFLDSAALLTLGVVLGVAGIGGTATTALVSAQAAHARLDAEGAAPADPRPAAVG